MLGFSPHGSPIVQGVHDAWQFWEVKSFVFVGQIGEAPSKRLNKGGKHAA